MPATTTRPSTVSPLTIAVTFVLGLAVLWIGPISCSTETKNASSERATEESPAATDRAILLNVGVVDETSEGGLPGSFLIETPSGTLWQVDPLEGGRVTKAFEKYPVGEEQRLLLYPEGKEGPRLAVPVTMKSDMSSVLASSRTDITVYDDSIIVTGPAVPDERMMFERPAPQPDAP